MLSVVLALIILLFVEAVLSPFMMILLTYDPDRLVVLAAGGVLIALGIGVALLVLRQIRRRHERQRTAPPNPAVAASLKWPATLPQAAFEAHCAAYLRQNGWTVDTVQANAAYGVFLDARHGSGARALLLCESRGEELTPIRLRSLAYAAADFPGARPATVTNLRPPPATAEIALAAGVQTLRVADLAQLASLVPAQAEPATPPPP